MTIARNRHARLLALCLWLFAACSSLPDEPLQPRPTLAPVTGAPATASSADYDAAQRVIIRYLEGWRALEYETMYASLTASARERMTYSTFRDHYEQAARALTLQTLEYQLQAMAAPEQRADILDALYSVTFHTAVVGSFSDEERRLSVLREDDGSWGIDWRPGLIFAEMDDGATLQLRASEAGRLNIYARDGSTLAEQGSARILVDIVPQRLPDREQCLAALALISDRDVAAMRAQIARTPANWVLEIASISASLYRDRQATIDETLSAQCAATLRSETSRRYPNGRLAPHVVGYVGLPAADELDELARRGRNAESEVGRSGVEASWDETLSGQPGGELRIIAADGRALRTLSSRSPTPARSVWLTIQPDLQAYIRNLIHETYESGRIDEGSAGAAAIVMDVRSGAIHALVSYPDFDLNALAPKPDLAPDALAEARAELLDPRLPQFNRVSQGIYPAGSVFKPVTYLAALDSGLYSLEHSYFCNGRWSRPEEGFVRTDWYPEGHNWVTTYTAIPLSCNPYFYESGFDLNQADPFRLPTYARRLGLGQYTGIAAIDEAAGAIEDPESVRRRRGYVWSFSDAVSMAIGQGFVSITPLQIARMYAAFANGGALVQPQLVWKSGLPGDEPTHLLAPNPQSSLDVEPAVLQRLRNSLCDVADQWYGTAVGAFSGSPLLAAGVCGKTGTAQDLRTGGDWLPHAWFVAFAPAANPEIVTLVMVENSGEGSVVAAPLVRQIMEYYYFGRPAAASSEASRSAADISGS